MNVHGGYWGDRKDILDFSVNLNPLGVPESVLDYITSNSKILEQYPSIDGGVGKQAISTYYNIPTNNIIMGNGAIELVYLFARAFRPKKVCIIHPTFNEYERAFHLVGSECIALLTKEEDAFYLSQSMLKELICKEAPEVVILCNPNNPTGTYYPIQEIVMILEQLKHYDGMLMVDESFMMFEDQPSSILLLNQYENLFIISSMTKYYAIAGIRLGYGLGSRAVIHALEQEKEPWTLNGIACNIVDILLNDNLYREKTNHWYKAQKKYLMEALTEIPGITPLESYGNFILCKTPMLSMDLAIALEAKGIYVRKCLDFKGLSPYYIRIAVRSHEHNQVLIDTLKHVLKI